jgi:arylsulfatase A-like enzyme
MLAAERLLDDAVVVLTADHGEALGERHPLPTSPTHFGEPSFEQLVRVPLLVSRRLPGDPERFMRTDDTFHLLLELAGVERAASSAELQPEELFLTEQRYWTYRKGRWKSIWARADPKPVLFDLVTDPDERSDVAAAHADLLAEHGRRLETLAGVLAAREWQGGDAAPADRARLRALGYVE